MVHACGAPPPGKIGVPFISHSHREAAMRRDPQAGLLIRDKHFSGDIDTVDRL